MAGPLDGIVVADFSRVLSGPWCTMTLGDLGADAIKIERPGTGDETRGWGPPFAGGESAYYVSTNRNKRSVELDLARADHREAAVRLVKKADVIIENFRPGTMDRLGFGEAECRALNPNVVYASITGFGLNGPARDRPGYDFTIQGIGGLMSLTGEPDGDPEKVGVAISDITAGLYCAIGILAAIRHRDVTGEGQRIHVSLLGSQVAWLANQASNYLNGGLEPTRMGNKHPNIVPYQVFHASDEPFVVAVANETIWRRFCAVIQRDELADDPRFTSNAERVANRAALTEDLAHLFVEQPRATWLGKLDAAGVPCGPINTIAQVFDDEQVRALGLVEELPHPTAGTVRLVKPPFELSVTPATQRRHPPLRGEHTEQLLLELGYSDEEARALMSDKPGETGAAPG
ncbi:MAG TPA: CaiB/BaiF CoA-transferase family protein [Actinomycetota bacterium]|nr:CaiB/BaiF CoA-transferase family protein [Actinomycetota bacterium]